MTHTTHLTHSVGNLANLHWKLERRNKQKPNPSIFGVQELDKIVESFRIQATRMVELERLCSISQLHKAPRENADQHFRISRAFALCRVSSHFHTFPISFPDLWPRKLRFASRERHLIACVSGAIERGNVKAAGLQMATLMDHDGSTLIAHRNEDFSNA